MNGLLKPKRKNGAAIAVPSWFLEECRSVWAAYKATGKKMADLGAELAASIKRPEPWGHSPISKFLDGSQVTSHLVDAFCEAFKIPRPVYYPRDLAEAKLIQRTVDPPKSGETPNPDSTTGEISAPIVEEKGPARKIGRLKQYDAIRDSLDRQRRDVLQTGDASSVRDRRVGSVGRSLADLDGERFGKLVATAAGDEVAAPNLLLWQLAGRRLLKESEATYRQILACARGYEATWQSESNDELHEMLISVAAGR